jgi:hypothetical protein
MKYGTVCLSKRTGNAGISLLTLPDRRLTLCSPQIKRHHRGSLGVSGAVRGTVAIDGHTGQLFARMTDCHAGTHKTKTSSISNSSVK